MNSNEVQLVRQAKEGDQAAFNALFRQYETLIYRLALHFVRSPDAAADVAQDAFIKAWERLPKLRKEAAFGGWLRSIALNTARDYLRGRRGDASIEDDPRGAESVVDDAQAPVDDLVQMQLSEDVRRAVMSLPEHQRTVVVMHHIEGLPVESIMEKLGLSKGTVVSRLSRGRKLLKRKLSAHLQG